MPCAENWSVLVQKGYKNAVFSQDDIDEAKAQGLQIGSEPWIGYKTPQGPSHPGFLPTALPGHHEPNTWVEPVPAPSLLQTSAFGLTSLVDLAALPNLEALAAVPVPAAPGPAAEDEEEEEVEFGPPVKRARHVTVPAASRSTRKQPAPVPLAAPTAPAPPASAPVPDVVAAPAPAALPAPAPASPRRLRTHSTSAIVVQPSPTAPRSSRNRTTTASTPTGVSKSRVSKAPGRKAVSAWSSSRPFVCEEEGCNEAFTRQEHLRRHVRSVHEKVREHVCVGCGWSFSRRDNMKQHQGKCDAFWALEDEEEEEEED